MPSTKSMTTDDPIQTVDCDKSSTLRWARYSPHLQLLKIDFKNPKTGTINATYEYCAFSPMDWAAFQAAESKGKYFAAFIRNAKDAQGDPKYPARRVK